ncbi:hypothetical protein MRB53_010068 [Persea americana]|uniref:Uncharacterized protein n=1 Tax=Persea americana TaxID=3435 RepID=A0ACC2LQP5_PERAE|nr:hypothetical protein MRB53_010068 [Persea americana]
MFFPFRDARNRKWRRLCFFRFRTRAPESRDSRLLLRCMQRRVRSGQVNPTIDQPGLSPAQVKCWYGDNVTSTKLTARHGAPYRRLTQRQGVADVSTGPVNKNFDRP